MNYGRLLILSTILAALSAPAFADTIYGEFDASGQGTILTTPLNKTTGGTALSIGGTIGTTGGGNLRPTGTLTSHGTGVFSNYLESESFFYHFIASGSPTATATFTFSTASVATPVEFLQATNDGVTMKFYITSVEDILVNSGVPPHGVAGGFDGVGFVTFSNEFVPGSHGTLYEEAVAYSVDLNKGSGLRPLTVEVFATAPSAAPEPSSLVLLGTGLFTAVGILYRRQRAAA